MRIKDKNGNTLCLIIKKHKMSEGKLFYTDDTEEFQFASFRLKKDEVIDRHYHFQNTREVKFTSEAIIVYDGRIQLDVYDLAKEFIQSEILVEGDVAILSSGGHALKLLEKSHFIKVKQGPYNENTDKERF